MSADIVDLNHRRKQGQPTELPEPTDMQRFLDDLQVIMLRRPAWARKIMAFARKIRMDLDDMPNA